MLLRAHPSANMIQTMTLAKSCAGIGRESGQRAYVPQFKPKPQAQPTVADVRRRAFNTRAVEGLSYAAVVKPPKAVPVKRKRESRVEPRVLSSSEITTQRHGDFTCFAVTCLIDIVISQMR